MLVKKIRFYWSQGMKYTAIPNMVLSVGTFVGVWLRGSEYRFLIIGVGAVVYLCAIIFAGYMDKRLGLFGHDVYEAEQESPMWKRQLRANDEILSELRSLQEEVKN